MVLKQDENRNILVFKYDLMKHKITIVTKDSEERELEKINGEDLKELLDYEDLEGYKFSGWFYETDEGKVLVDPHEEIYSDEPLNLKIYGEWERLLDYYISFQTTDGKVLKEEKGRGVEGTIIDKLAPDQIDYDGNSYRLLGDKNIKITLSEDTNKIIFNYKLIEDIITEPEKPGDGEGIVTPPVSPEGEGPKDPEGPSKPGEPTTPEEEADGVHKPYIEGYKDGSVRPEADVSREEVATMVYRILEKEGAGQHKFPDVELGRWSEKYIGKLSSERIIEGYEDGNFRPLSNMTRGEFAALIARAKGLERLSGDSRFDDIAGHWSEGYIKAIEKKEWAEGFEDGNFRPDADISRAEMVTILNRILDRDVKKENILEDVNIFPDLEEGKWYYANMLEASIEHSYKKDQGLEVWLDK